MHHRLSFLVARIRSDAKSPNSNSEAPRRDKHSGSEKTLRLVPAARKKVFLVPMSKVEDDLREMEKDLHDLHVQQIREESVHRRLLSTLNTLSAHIWPMSVIRTLLLLWRTQWRPSHTGGTLRIGGLLNVRKQAIGCS